MRNNKKKENKKKRWKKLLWYTTVWKLVRGACKRYKTCTILLPKNFVHGNVQKTFYGISHSAAIKKKEQRKNENKICHWQYTCVRFVRWIRFAFILPAPSSKNSTVTPEWYTNRKITQNIATGNKMKKMIKKKKERRDAKQGTGFSTSTWGCWASVRSRKIDEIKMFLCDKRWDATGWELSIQRGFCACAEAKIQICVVHIENMLHHMSDDRSNDLCSQTNW